MTGNIKQGLGLLAVALVAAIVGFAALNADAVDAGGLLVAVAAIAAVVGLLRIAGDLLRSPQGD